MKFICFIIGIVDVVLLPIVGIHGIVNNQNHALLIKEFLPQKPEYSEPSARASFNTEYAQEVPEYDGLRRYDQAQYNEPGSPMVSNMRSTGTANDESGYRQYGGSFMLLFYIGYGPQDRQNDKLRRLLFYGMGYGQYYEPLKTPPVNKNSKIAGKARSSPSPDNTRRGTISFKKKPTHSKLQSTSKPSQNDRANRQPQSNKKSEPDAPKGQAPEFENHPVLLVDAGQEESEHEESEGKDQSEYPEPTKAADIPMQSRVQDNNYNDPIMHLPSRLMAPPTEYEQDPDYREPEYSEYDQRDYDDPSFNIESREIAYNEPSSDLWFGPQDPQYDQQRRESFYGVGYGRYDRSFMSHFYMRYKHPSSENNWASRPPSSNDVPDRYDEPEYNRPLRSSFSNMWDRQQQNQYDNQRRQFPVNDYGSRQQQFDDPRGPQESRGFRLMGPYDQPPYYGQRSQTFFNLGLPFWHEQYDESRMSPFNLQPQEHEYNSLFTEPVTYHDTSQDDEQEEASDINWEYPVHDF